VTDPYEGPTPPPGGLPSPRPRPDDQELRIDENIQGNVLAAFNKDHQTFLLLRFADGDTGRAWLAEVLPDIATNAQVTAFNEQFSRKRRVTGTDPADSRVTWTNVSFTGPGLGKLSPSSLAALSGLDGVDPTVVTWLNGSAAIQDEVGDTGTSAPEHWVFGANPDEIDAIVCIAADRPSDLAVRLEAQRSLAARHQVTIVFQQDGGTLSGPARGHEHFGFKDGISQPGVRGFDPPDTSGNQDEVAGKPGTDLVEAGEFVLGYVGHGEGRPGRAVPLWMWDGSFLVFRRLAQNVPGFWSDVQSGVETLEAGQRTGDTGIRDAEALGARLVGRWRNGTPTDDCPLNDIPLPSDPGLNAFDFSQDAGGARTPHAAHIRKVYPRKGAVSATPAVTEEAAGQRRILRRGIPFGLAFDPTAGHGAGADADRGLVFQCYQASLLDQFVFLQQAWINADSFTEPDDGKDAVIGQDTKVALHPNDTTVAIDLHQWVATQGSLFALTPSQSSLRALAAAEELPVFPPSEG